MDMVDFQEKMDGTHRMYLCRMLGVKELPKALLERYAQVKRMVDRIDAHLTPGDLAMIIVIDADGFGKTTEGEDARLQAEADKLAAKPAKLAESDDKVIEEAVEQPVALTDEQAEKEAAEKKATPEEAPTISGEHAVSGTTGQAAEKPDEGKAMLWSPGMPVKVLIADELKVGKIFTVHPTAVDEKQQLTVVLDDGEAVTVNEDEVEAV